MNIKKYSLVLFGLLVSPLFAQAKVFKGLSGATEALTAVGKATEQTKTDLPTMIGNGISVVLGIMGIILVIFIIYAGVLYMTAGGEAEKTKKAKALIMNAVIGMVLVVAAYAISAFVIGQLVGISGGGGQSPKQKLDNILKG